mgnify:CR=1 FL=1
MIYLTGKFIHGTEAEVSSILQSYSAEITSSTDADCCIVGDIGEDIDGAMISKLRDLGVPIFNESEFFDVYEIDADVM